MNANVLNTAITILARHIQPGPIAAPLPVVQPINETNILLTSIAILQAYMNTMVSASASGPITVQPTVIEGQLRRGPIVIDGKIAIADTTDPLKPPTETSIYSVDIKPKYSDNPNDDPSRPYSYTITPNIGGIVDRTAEIDNLNDAMKKQQEIIDDLTSKVKATAASLAGP